MEQEDYLKKSIDQLGKVLSRLLGDILGLKNQGSLIEMISLVEETLKSELSIDLLALFSIPKNRLIETIQQNKEISNDNLDKLAEILSYIANEEKNKEKRNKFFEHILEIYNYLENNDKTYSIERYYKIEKIKKEISK